MTSKQIQYVIALANAGTFAKASEELGISQPSLSQYIKKIETQLGAELFDRSGGTVRLTDSGRVYVETGRKILDLEHQMNGKLNDLTEHKSGTVIVGTSPYRAAAMMPTVAKKYQSLYPGMHLVIEEMTSQELKEAAEHGQFDICLTMLPVDGRLFDYEKIAEEELILAVPTSFPIFNAVSMPDRKYPAIDVSDLDGMSFIMIRESQLMQQALKSLSVDHNLSFRQAAVVKSLESQIAMVRAGVGMALLPTGIERFCLSDEVRFYSLKQSLPKRDVVVSWRKAYTLNKAVKDLIALMKEIQW